MKKYYVITSIVLFVGVILTVCGALMGGVRSISFDNGRPQVADSRQHRKEQTVKKFKNLYINTNRADVEIKQGNEYRVKQNVIGKKFATIGQESENLTIDEDAKTKFNVGINLSFPDPKIEITIPYDEKINVIKVNSEDGHIKVNDIEASEMRLNGNTSDFEIRGVKVSKQTELKTANGEISFKNSQLNKLNSFVNSGDIEVENTTIADVSELSTTNGDISVKTTELSDSSIKTTSGDVELERVNMKKNNRISTTNGDIDIEEINNIGFIYQSRSSASKLDYYDREYSKSFEKNPNSTDILRITTNSGEVEIS